MSLYLSLKHGLEELDRMRDWGMAWSESGVQRQENRESTGPKWKTETGRVDISLSANLPDNWWQSVLLEAARMVES